MTTPPRSIESLLEALGAESGFRDNVVGDLAEEFTSRVERDGLESARRWYRREAMRAAPHLLRSGWASVRQRGLGHLVGILFTAFTGMLIADWVIAGSVFAALRSELLHTSPRLLVSHPVWQASLVAVGMVSATFAGYDGTSPLLGRPTIREWRTLHSWERASLEARSPKRRPSGAIKSRFGIVPSRRHAPSSDSAFTWPTHRLTPRTAPSVCTSCSRTTRWSST
jgi:hypothetical protein